MTEPLHPHIALLLEEYRAVYGLVTLRINALDRRVPGVGATLAAFLGGVTVLPSTAQLLVLFGLPIALVWYFRSVITHAQAFEDAVRRIDQIERDVNDLAGAELLRFQSRHPSRSRPGGRTGRGTIQAVFAMCLLLLLACGLVGAAADIGDPILMSLTIELVAIAGILGARAWQASRYRYESDRDTN